MKNLIRLFVVMLLATVAVMPSLAQANCNYESNPYFCNFGPTGDTYVYDMTTGLITFTNVDGTVEYGSFELLDELASTYGTPGAGVATMGTFGPFTLHIVLFENGDLTYQVDYVAGDVAYSELATSFYVPDANAVPPAGNPAAVPPAGGPAVLATPGLYTAIITNPTVACVVLDNDGDPEFAEFLRLIAEIEYAIAILEGELLYDVLPPAVPVSVSADGQILNYLDEGLTLQTANPAVYITNFNDYADPNFLMDGSIATTVSSPTQLDTIMVVGAVANYDGIVLDCDIAFNITSIFIV